MKVSVVICTYGEERISDLRDAVNSILTQIHSNYEILIVADNDERLLSFLSKSFSLETVKTIVCEEKGLSNARNLGVRHSTGDIVAFLDDDAVADERWLSHLVENYGDDPQVAGVGGIIKSTWEGNRPNWFPKELDWIVGCTYKGHPEERNIVRNVIGCNMSFRRELFDKVGLFESSIGRVGKRLLAGEEMEFCVRISRAFPQAKIIYDPSAIIHHKVHKNRQSFRYMLRRAYNEGISKSLISRLRHYKVSKKVLSTENMYLKHIVAKAIPERLSNIVRGKNIRINTKHIVILFLTITLVVTGYAIGKMIIKKAQK